MKYIIVACFPTGTLLHFWGSCCLICNLFNYLLLRFFPLALGWLSQCILPSCNVFSSYLVVYDHWPMHFLIFIYIGKPQRLWLEIPQRLWLEIPQRLRLVCFGFPQRLRLVFCWVTFLFILGNHKDWVEIPQRLWLSVQKGFILSFSTFSYYYWWPSSEAAEPLKCFYLFLLLFIIFLSHWSLWQPLEPYGHVLCNLAHSLRTGPSLSTPSFMSSIWGIATNWSKLDLCLHTQPLNRMTDFQKWGTVGFPGSRRVQ